MTPKTRKDGQLPTDGSNDNNNSVNANGGNDMNEVNTVNPNQRILEVGQPNGPETESPDLIQQFARMLSDPENETAKALMAMFKAAMARNQPTMEVSVNVNVNSGQSSGHPNSVTEMPSSQLVIAFYHSYSVPSHKEGGSNFMHFISTAVGYSVLPQLQCSKPQGSLSVHVSPNSYLLGAILQLTPLWPFHHLIPSSPNEFHHD